MIIAAAILLCALLHRAIVRWFDTPHCPQCGAGRWWQRMRLNPGERRNPFRRIPRGRGVGVECLSCGLWHAGGPRGATRWLP